MSDILVRLPWPPSKLSANGSQGDFRGKAAAAKKYKAQCLLECIAQGVIRAEYASAHVEVTFHPPSLRRYDLDNALKKAKQGLDAIAERTGVDDADWQSMTLLRGYKVKRGAIVVHMREAKENQNANNE